MGLNYNPGRVTYGSSEAEGGSTAKVGCLLNSGTGAGNYTSASTSYVDVDATNLTSKIIIPVGFVANITAAGVLGILTASQPVAVALADGGTVLQQQVLQPAVSGAAAQVGFGIQWLLVGDNKGHSLSLQFKTTVGTSSVIMFNDSATHVPSMITQLTQSNFL